MHCNALVSPPPDFVLCRDEHGNAKSIYGEAVWDFNPYRLSAKKISKIYFGRVFDEDGPAQEALIEEAKYLLYCLIYFAGGGRLGRLSAGTLYLYWSVLFTCRLLFAKKLYLKPFLQVC